MRKIEPAFPDVLPLTHQLGALPAAVDGWRLDPVEMRFVRAGVFRQDRVVSRTVPRRPVRLLVHGAVAAAEQGFLARLLDAGCGLVLVPDPSAPEVSIPTPTLAGQVVILVPWVPAFWGGQGVGRLNGWREKGFVAGVVLCLGPSPAPHEAVAEAVAQSAAAGAQFVISLPLAIAPEERHRMYDARAGEMGNGALEDLLFHTDLARLAVELEREASRACLGLGMPESIPGPATSLVGASACFAANQLTLWARRLDLLDGVASTGWQLRRAARALLASRREPEALLVEDNLRVIPGFNPWVEAFARSCWARAGEPYEAVLARWIAG
jgi:hypothetical protein